MAKNRIRLLPAAKPLDRFQKVFITKLKAYQRLKNSVLKTSDPDRIHDLRTTLRRLRSALKIFEHFTSSKVDKTFKKSLRKLIPMLGGLRNIDEALLFFHARVAFSTSHPFYKSLNKMRSVEWRKIKKQLRLFDHQFNKLMSEMTIELKATSFTKQSETALLVFFSTLSDHYSKKIHDLLAVSTEYKEWKSRHALRIAIRKWRYLLEIFAVVQNRNYDLLVKQLKKYQLVLGQINDVTAFGKLCKNMKLSSAERKLVKITLFKEEKKLLKQFTKQIRQKPLTII